MRERMQKDLRSADDLPRTIAIFPLGGALLLPGRQLPLNIFEPRYLDMTDHALAGSRLIGMIQPRNDTDESPRPSLYPVGCIGYISAWSETADGRYLITLSGVTRFRVVEELSVTTRFRQVVAEYDEFGDDFADPGSVAGVDRERLLKAVERYLSAQSLTADIGAMAQAPTDRLVDTLAMICPFSVSEKQALLEAPTVSRRAEALVALMEMASVEDHGGPDRSLN